ncbi:MAG: YihA family ribosome biogenesis GTP-binding protein [Nitrospinae bacterium]|nr:YihA family ribosome biogenesis GTP-binding protein [Nitrospinota bacterium]
MRVFKAEFVKSAIKPEHYPKLNLPEIAFAGRSNVGKSSLINSLLGRKGLVKVSKSPGKTQALNFFTVNDSLSFVDMPGYGFASVPEKLRQSWGHMVENYLKSRAELQAVIALLDCRRIPNDDDLNLLGWLSEFGIPAIPVFTKIDKIPKTHRLRELKEPKKVLAEVFGGTAPHTVMYSALSGEGKKELWHAISKAAGGGKRSLPPDDVEG